MIIPLACKAIGVRVWWEALGTEGNNPICHGRNSMKEMETGCDGSEAAKYSIKFSWWHRHDHDAEESSLSPLAYRMAFILQLNTVSASRHHSLPLKVKGHVLSRLRRIDCAKREAFSADETLLRRPQLCEHPQLDCRPVLPLAWSSFNVARLRPCLQTLFNFFILFQLLYFISKMYYFLYFFIIYIFFSEKESVLIHLCEKKRGILFE